MQTTFTNFMFNYSLYNTEGASIHIHFKGIVEKRCTFDDVDSIMIAGTKAALIERRVDFEGLLRIGETEWVPAHQPPPYHFTSIDQILSEGGQIIAEKLKQRIDEIFTS